MPRQENHPVFKEPGPNIKVWRYRAFTKFISSLENGGLFFCRADLLGDPFEGSYPRAHKKLRPIMYKDSPFPPEIRPSIEKFNAEYSKKLRQWMMINCWHMNKVESAAMWKLYTKTNESICIQSRYKLLRNCLDDENYIGAKYKIYSGKVQYIDYNKVWVSEGNIYSPFMHKRMSFAHERELRVVINTNPKHPRWMDENIEPSANGIWIKVDFEKLIEKIFIAPTSPGWFKKLVEGIIKKYGIKKEVIHSPLDEEPFY